MRKTNRLKLPIICAILLSICTRVSLAYSSAPPINSPKHDLLHSFSQDITAELDLAKQHNKTGLLLFFSTQHCPFCQRMKNTVFNQASVQQYFRPRFQMIEIDIESEKILIDQQQRISYRSFAQSKRVRLTPTIVFLNLSGELLYKHIGMIANPTEFIWLGEYVSKGHASEQSFAHFKRHKRNVLSQ